MTEKGRLFSKMVFTKDPKLGYKSFDDCYADWEEKAEKNSSINLLETFKIDPKILKNNPKLGRGRHGRGGRKDGT